MSDKKQSKRDIQRAHDERVRELTKQTVRRLKEETDRNDPPDRRKQGPK